MAGINLSQSMQESRQVKKKKNLFDMGFIGSLILFLIVAGLWGGLEWYIRDINQKIAALDSTMAESAGKLSGKNANQVSDIADRIMLISRSSEDIVDPQSLLAELESLMVPEVVLTKYDYNKGERLITVAGTTDNFKYLAQQILALKTKDTFSNIKVNKIERTKDGKISFELKSDFLGVVK